MTGNSSPKRYSVLMGFFAAALGFSYALATSSTTDEGVAAGIRAAGSNPRQPLTFTDPFVNGSTDRDLGDCALGSAIVRYVHARGGFPPHRFTSDRTTLGDDGTPLFIGKTTLGEAEIALPATAKPGSSTAAVFLNGRVSGQVGDKTGTIVDGTPLRFDITVADSKGTNPNKHDEIFRLTMVSPNGAFKFAQSSLNSGVQFNKYYDKLEVNSGNGPYTFTASNIMVTSNGSATAVAKFEDIGLFLVAKTGVLTGRPIKSGSVSFLADCVDSKGNHALSRDKSKTGQVITFNVDPAVRISSDLFSTKMSIKGDTKTAGKDTIQYSGLLNLGTQTVSGLDGLGVTLSIGNYTPPTVTLTGGKGSTAGPPAMSVTLGSDGTLKISIKSDSFGTAMSIVGNSELANDSKILAVSVVIADATSTSKPAYQSSELLKFRLKARSSKFDLEYKFGPGNLGGGFIITSVSGKDDKPETGDSWLVKFISLPPQGMKLSNFGTVAEATVGIGTDFTNSINVALSTNGVKSTEKRDSKQPVVTKLAFNQTSGQGSVQTGLLPAVSPLPNTQTNIKPALNAGGKRSPFPFIITFNDTNGKELLGFEGSRKIVPKGTQWVSKDLAH